MFLQSTLKKSSYFKQWQSQAGLIPTAYLLLYFPLMLYWELNVGLSMLGKYLPVNAISLDTFLYFYSLPSILYYRHASPDISNTSPSSKNIYKSWFAMQILFSQTYYSLTLKKFCLKELPGQKWKRDWRKGGQKSGPTWDPYHGRVPRPGILTDAMIC